MLEIIGEFFVLKFLNIEAKRVFDQFSFISKIVLTDCFFFHLLLVGKNKRVKTKNRESMKKTAHKS